MKSLIGVPKNKFDALALQHETDRYYKAFSTCEQFITLQFGILSRCDSMSEAC